MADITTASPTDSLRALSTVLLPVVAKGPIARRPRAVGLAERFGADQRAVEEMQRLRARYGPGPLRLRLPGRELALVLEPGDVHRVLNGSPEPFAPATSEKRGALNHFQPEGVLASSTEARADRRPLNEAALETGQTVHRHADAMTAAVEEEVDALLGHVSFTGALHWDAFAVTWWRIVRRVVLGHSARDDEQVTDDLQRLRRDANLAYLRPRRTRRRERFLRQLDAHVERAEPGSLVEMLAATGATPGEERHQQVPQWLFAFDAAAWASVRALALLAAHPSTAEQVRAELDHAPDLPLLRATVLESLRLWPTTPLILRETTQVTTWEAGTLDPGTSVVLFAPYFHRNDQRLAEAHRFAPELWLRERTDEEWPLVPFSGGPGMCPGRDVVLLVASLVLGRLLQRHGYAVQDGGLHPDRPLPGTLDMFRLRFTPAPA